MSTEEGWLYLAMVIDIASRCMVGWATADRLRADLVTDALTAVCRKCRLTLADDIPLGSWLAADNSPYWQSSWGCACRPAAPGSAGTTHSPNPSSRPPRGHEAVARHDLMVPAKAEQAHTIYLF